MHSVENSPLETQFGGFVDRTATKACGKFVFDVYPEPLPHLLASQILAKP